MYRTPVKISMLLSVMISSHLVSHGFMITRATAQVALNPIGPPACWRKVLALKEYWWVFIIDNAPICTPACWRQKGGGGDHAGVGQHHIEADGDVHDLLGGDVGVGGGCGQAAGEGGGGCPWGCGQDGGAAAGQNGVRKGSVVTNLQHSNEY